MQFLPIHAYAKRRYYLQCKRRICTVNTMLIDSHMREMEDIEFWDSYAPKYANDKIADLEGYKKTLKRVSTLLDKSSNVVELGCGTATTAIRLAQYCHQYLATDISSGMIAQGQAKLDNSAVANLTLKTATASSLPHLAHGYDVILGFNYLHLVSNLPETLFNVHSLLKTGGKFITKTPCMKDMGALFKLTISAALPVMRIFGKAPENVNMLTRTELEGAIKTAGFEIEAIEWHGTKGKDPRPFIVARKI